MSNARKSRQGNSYVQELPSITINPFKKWYQETFHKRMPVYIASSLKKRLYKRYLISQLLTETDEAQKQFLRLELELAKY